jgi:F-type H+-transporting ATPase subunit delta
MAEKTTLARPYAKAVFEFADQAASAEKSKTFEKWSQVLGVLSEIASDARVKPLLKDSSITASDMADFFKSVSEKVLDIYAQNFVSELAQRKRLEVLPEIKALYEEMRADAEQTAELQLLTAIPLNEQEKQLYIKKLSKFPHLKNRKINMHCETDQNLLGGYIATGGNFVIDGSVRHFLTHLKETKGDPI